MAIRTIVVLLGHNNNTIGHLPSLVTISTTTEGGKASKPREGRKEGRKEGASPHDRSKLVLGTGDCQGCVQGQILAFAIINSIVWPTQSAICMIMTAIRGR